MTKKDIPVYVDPDDFEARGNAVKYPCSTEFMVYDPLVHRYYLTEAALERHGIDVTRDYAGGVADKVGQFIREVTEDIYDLIAQYAPYNFRYHCSMIARSLARNLDRYTARKQFERALIYQAVYKLDNLDPRDINGIDLETGNAIYIKQLRRELRHLSPKAYNIIKSMGLLFNGNIPGAALIDYSEVM